jgi:hypothetical protein
MFFFYHGIFSDERELDDCQVSENTKKVLLNNIRRRLTPQAVKCRAGKHHFFSFFCELDLKGG